MSKKIAKKNNIITFRLSDSDIKLYRSVCTDYHLRLSSFIRDAIKLKIDTFDYQSKDSILPNREGVICKQ